MAGYETTDGETVITTEICDCGLTGGCPKCRPYIIPKTADCEDWLPPFNEVAELYDIFPATHEGEFLDDNLREFYRKKGYLYKGE